MTERYSNPALEAEIRALVIEEREVRVKLRRAQALQDEERTHAVRAALPDLNPARSLSHGVWECRESPTGRCVYDPLADPCLDDCLFCHGPDERK